MICKLIVICIMIGILYVGILYLFKRYEKNKFYFESRILQLEIRVGILENKNRKKVKNK